MRLRTQVHASVEADEVSEDEAMKRLNWTSKPGQAESKGERMP
jgi:hypothetical protein